MSIQRGVSILAKTVSAIYALEKRMRERGENVLDNVRIRKLETRKWNDFIVY